MIRDHYRNTENRKAELDPSTFDHAEQFQMTPADIRLRNWTWRALIAWCGGCVCLGGWALWTLAKAVL